MKAGSGAFSYQKFGARRAAAPALRRDSRLQNCWITLQFPAHPVIYGKWIPLARAACVGDGCAGPSGLRVELVSMPANPNTAASSLPPLCIGAWLTTSFGLPTQGNTCASSREFVASPNWKTVRLEHSVGI